MSFAHQWALVLEKTGFSSFEKNSPLHGICQRKSDFWKNRIKGFKKQCFLYSIKEAKHFVNIGLKKEFYLLTTKAHCSTAKKINCFDRNFFEGILGIGRNLCCTVYIHFFYKGLHITSINICFYWNVSVWQTCVKEKNYKKLGNIFKLVF